MSAVVKANLNLLAAGIEVITCVALRPETLVPAIVTDNPTE